MDKVVVLKIDKDCFVDRDWIEDYVKVMIATCERFGARVLSIKTCKSKRKGLHFYVHVNPSLDANLANKLQWLLGDDSARVDFNRARIRSGLNEWNKLFEVSGTRLTTVYECPWSSLTLTHRPARGS